MTEREGVFPDCGHEIYRGFVKEINCTDGKTVSVQGKGRRKRNIPMPLMVVACGECNEMQVKPT